MLLLFSFMLCPTERNKLANQKCNKQLLQKPIFDNNTKKHSQKQGKDFRQNILTTAQTYTFAQLPTLREADECFAVPLTKIHFVIGGVSAGERIALVVLCSTCSKVLVTVTG